MIIKLKEERLKTYKTQVAKILPCINIIDTRSTTQASIIWCAAHGYMRKGVGNVLGNVMGVMWRNEIFSFRNEETGSFGRNCIIAFVLTTGTLLQRFHFEELSLITYQMRYLVDSSELEIQILSPSRQLYGRYAVKQKWCGWVRLSAWIERSPLQMRTIVFWARNRHDLFLIVITVGY